MWYGQEQIVVIVVFMLVVGKEWEMLHDKRRGWLRKVSDEKKSKKYSFRVVLQREYRTFEVSTWRCWMLDSKCSRCVASNNSQVDTKVKKRGTEYQAVNMKWIVSDCGRYDVTRAALMRGVGTQ